ncbi:MAG: hypothetical protein PGN16_17365 [Sphingomonas phyllosphaerae]|uniref:hypothetical protein n=1 Tax=Sphingomonas phyllosphaerae TaxID=257003 RepID=UPI002FF783A2
MTGQRRYARLQTDTAAELKAWRMTFKSGYDFLRALPRIGVEITSNHQPDLQAAKDAWARLGDAFLAAHEPDARGDPWALRTFGLPSLAGQPIKPRGRRR